MQIGMSRVLRDGGFAVCTGLSSLVQNRFCVMWAGVQMAVRSAGLIIAGLAYTDESWLKLSKIPKTLRMKPRPSRR